MEKDDLLGTLKDGVNLAGKVAARGVGEAVKAVKSATPAPKNAPGETGLYYQRHLQSKFGEFMPALEYQEVQAQSKLILGIIKNIATPAAERIFVAGCQSLLTGNLADARDKFTEASIKDTQFTDAYFMMGALSLSLDDYPRAGDAFQKALLCQGGLGNKIRKYLNSLRMTLCLTDYSSVVFFPDLLGLNMLSVFAMRCQGQGQEGIRLLDQLQGVLPAHPLIVFMLACLHLEAGQYPQVIEKTLPLLPESNLHVAALILQARAYLAIGDPQPFVEMFRRLTTRADLDPQLLWDVRQLLGAAYLQAGMKSDGERELQWVSTRSGRAYQDILERLGLDEEPAPETAAPAAAPAVAAAVAAVAAAESELEAEAEKPEPEPAPVAVNPQPGASPPRPPAAPWDGRLSSDDGKVDFPLTAAGVTIGREAGDIQLAWDSSVSMNHARIVWDQNAYWVEDQGSTNGTWVNGHRIARRLDLNRGDIIAVGQTRLHVQ